MSRFSQLAAALAATSAIVVSASMANATVSPPRPTINVVVPPRPIIAAVVPIRPAVKAIVPSKTALPTKYGIFNPALSKWGGTVSSANSSSSIPFQTYNQFSPVTFNGQAATRINITVIPNNPRKFGYAGETVTSIILGPNGKQLWKGSGTCNGLGSCTFAQPPSTQPPSTGYSPAIVSEANAIGVTPADVVLLGSHRPPGSNDPHVIQLTKQKIAQPSGVTCSGHVVATFGASGSINPGGTKNGAVYTGAAGSQGGWVYTCS
jgi:hypothetical protein